MRAVELVGVRQFRNAEMEIAPPRPGEVQVTVSAVGICGSDLHAYAEGGVGDMTCEYPMVLGHEPAGVVSALGPGTSGWSIGDRAALEPAHYCYHCALCLKGRHNLCENLRFLSTVGQPGFFRERVNLPAENLVALPSSLSLSAGTLVEPLAVALHALDLGKPRVGETAVVFGCGPIGLLTIAALRRAGIKRLWALEPVAHRGELAKKMGADVVLPPEAFADILPDTGKRGVDLVFDCAAKEETANQAMRLSALGGRVVLTGISSGSRLSLDVHLWRRKELGLHQVRRSNHDGPAARDLLAAEPAFYAPLLTHERPLEALPQAFSIAETYADGVGKMVVRI